MLYVLFYLLIYLSSSLFFGTFSSPFSNLLFFGGSDMEWGFNLIRMGLSWSSVPMATPSSSVWWRCPTENPFSVMENPLNNDQQLFFLPPKHGWGMKWCLEIYWNLPPLWFLFRDSLGWCYQWDRLRGLKISGQKISDKSLNQWLPGLLHFTDISDWSGGVIFDSHTGMVPGRSFVGPLCSYCYLRRWRAVMHNQIPHT